MSEQRLPKASWVDVAVNYALFLALIVAAFRDRELRAEVKAELLDKVTTMWNNLKR